MFFSNSSSLLRGVSYALIVGSLIFVFGGYFAGKDAENAKNEKVELYKSDPSKFIDTEYQKVEQIHNGWLGIRIFWTLFLVVSVVMFFFVTKPIWSGVEVGILIIGTFGHIEEVISYQHNERYRLEVQQERNNIQNNS